MMGILTPKTSPFYISGSYSVPRFHITKELCSKASEGIGCFVIGLTYFKVVPKNMFEISVTIIILSLCKRIPLAFSFNIHNHLDLPIFCKTGHPNVSRVLH